MIATLIHFLLDTNILVYAYDRTDQTKRSRAKFLLRRLGNSRTAALSAQVLGEFFVTVTRRIPTPLTLEQAERSITNYARSWPVYAITPTIVMEAVRAVDKYQLSYWDALIWATAKLNGVPYVLSEDVNDGAVLGGVRLLNPFTEHFDLATWAPV